MKKAIINQFKAIIKQNSIAIRRKLFGKFK